MKHSSQLFFVPLLLNAAIALNAQPSNAPSQPVTETFFGKQVTDPYRNLENLKDSAVLQWMKAQSDYARSVLNSIPGREHLISTMKDLANRKSERISSLVITNNDLYFYLKTVPGDQTEKLYTRRGFDGEETLLFDPTTYSKDTTQKYTISTFPRDGISPSDDGSFVAFTIAPNGSGSYILLVMDVKEKKLLPERIDRCLRNEMSWLPDNTGFFFSRLQSADSRDKDWLKNSKVYLHKLGTDPSADKEFFSAVKYPELGIEPDDGPFVMYDKGSHYLFGFAFSVDRRLSVFYAPESELNSSSINWRRLFSREDEVHWFNVTDKDLYIYTSKNAPHFTIVKTSLQAPDLAHVEVLVPEDPEDVIKSFSLTSDGLYYTNSYLLFWLLVNTFHHKKQWVDDALKYAEEKGVLLVHAAMNDRTNIDSVVSYPISDFLASSGRAKNVITVGAIGIGTSCIFFKLRERTSGCICPGRRYLFLCSRQ